jgi:hypothetical protein
MKLLAVISQHGLGHLAQAAPVLNRLRALQPELELTIWTELSTAALRARIDGPFTHRHEAADVGLIMHDAMCVDLAASHAAYQAFHADWPHRVRHEADWLSTQAFDQVFADVAYLPLAAAALAGIESTALCSLNWADITQAYLAQRPDMKQIFGEMSAAYASVGIFLQPTPSMPMSQLPCRQVIAPIAGIGTRRRRELAEKWSLPDTRKLALIGFGGIAYQGKGQLPEIPNVTWLAPDDWQSNQADTRADVIPFSRLALPFLDLLASSDLLVTKVGYGSFVEATAHAVPVLYLDRPDWPETPYLAAWLAKHGNAAVIEEAALFSGQLETVLTELWQQPRKTAPLADGAIQAARHLLAH